MRWDGELVHTKSNRNPVVMANRWSLQRDEGGRPVGIPETKNDIATESAHVWRPLRDTGLVRTGYSARFHSQAARG